MLAGFYWLAVDHPPGVKRRVWPGAAAAIVSWLFVSWGFGAYTLSIANNYALYYGSLAAVAVLLVWLYLSSLTLVVGAEVNAETRGLALTGRGSGRASGALLRSPPWRPSE